MATDLADRAPRRGSAIAPALWRNRLLIGLIVLHFAAVHSVCLYLGQPFASGTTSTLVALLQLQIPLFLILLLFWRLVWTMAVARPARPIAYFAEDLKGILLNRERIFSGIFAFTAMCFFASSFAVAKDLIPAIQPFSWDPLFADIDRALHFGTDPWKLLFTVTGTPFVTTVINVAYHLWLLLAYFIIFVACFNVSQHAKHQTYLVADVLCWVIGGNILATVFASVGPVYYAVFGFGEDFVPLMNTLETFNEKSPVWALDVQRMLIDGYFGEGGLKGISAMPSMHVASTTTMTLYAFSVSRRWGYVMTAFLAVILIGSVQLGWHYAIDGYVSILLAITMYWIARRLVGLFQTA